MNWLNKAEEVIIEEEEREAQECKNATVKNYIIEIFNFFGTFKRMQGLLT